ncbi:MAG: antirestriction protein ArdA [Pseudomonadota bacterium]
MNAATTLMENHYYGCYSSLADYTQEFTEQSSEIPSHLELLINYERMGRDWGQHEKGTREKGTHLFSLWVKRLALSLFALGPWSVCSSMGQH